MLKFVGEEGRQTDESGVDRRSDSPEASALARDRTRTRRSGRLGRIVRPIKRRAGDRRFGSELVSPAWGPSDEFDLELDRSRRFGRQFALVCVLSRRGLEDRWTSARELAYGLNSLIRRVDRVWIDGFHVYVLLPECDRTMVEAMLARVREPMDKLLGERGDSEVSFAVFPEDGLTSGALYAALSADQGPSEREGAPPA